MGIILGSTIYFAIVKPDYKWAWVNGKDYL
jgi:hypothetical protein